MNEINGNRIKLAVIPIELAQEEYQIFKNPNLFVYTKHDNFKSIEEAQAFIERHNQAGNFWGIFLKSNKLIGNCQFAIKGTTGELSYTIAEEYWGHGFASETVKTLIEFGFKSFSLNKVIGGCVPDNVASKKVMLKNGMSFFTLEKRAFEKNGRVYDLAYFERRFQNYEG
ncbi:GNAT family N-acetyltransferase [Liquorilactobacillus mali]|nr:GNAT family N-acetyltransferase [Liquorilactobacillus mali]